MPVHNAEGWQLCMYGFANSPSLKPFMVNHQSAKLKNYLMVHNYENRQKLCCFNRQL